MTASEILFIYNERESEVDSIVQRINNLGYNTFFWREDIKIGADALNKEEEILLTVSKVVVFLGSMGWGPNHLRLTSLAVQKQRQIVPVLIGQVNQKDMNEAGQLFHDKRYIDLTGIDPTGFDKLIRAIGPRAKFTDPSTFDKMISDYLSGDDNSRSDMLGMASRLRRDQKIALGQRIRTELESFPMEYDSDEQAVTDKLYEARATQRAWLVSLLIRVDPLNKDSKVVIRDHLNVEEEPNEDIRFWTLAGLYLEKVNYTIEFTKAIEHQGDDSVAALATLILDTRKNFVSSFREILRGNEPEKKKAVLKALRVYAVPQVFEDVLYLIEKTETRYDTFCALINPEWRNELKGVESIYSATQMLNFVLSLKNQTDEFHIRRFCTIFYSYPENLVMEAINNFPPGQEDFLRTVKGVLGNSSSIDFDQQPISAGYLSDHSDATIDLMDIKKDVATLSALMLSNKIEPPLAIGLFGSWGSGKSFFMEALEIECNELKKLYVGDKVGPYHHDVVQIRFNAWNYSDTNLWASLVHHIFESLSQYVTPVQTEHEKLNDFATEIERKQLEVDLAHSRLNEKQQDLQLAESELTQLEQARLNEPIDLLEVGLSDYYATLNDEQKTAAKKLLENYGISELHTSVKDMEAAISDAKSVGGRISGVISWMFDKENLWLKAFILFMLFIGVPVIGYILNVYFPTLVSQIATLILKIAGILSGMSVFIKKGLKQVKDGLVIIEDTKLRISKMLEAKRTEPSKNENELKERIEELRKREEDLKIEQENATHNLNTAKVEYAGFKKKISLGSFVSERSQSKDYGQHLSIMTTIRKDFKVLVEKLSKNDYQLEGKRVTRIILYIDDLDRCQPEKVYEVLQAVHLLLAYKLFVVVVGVDPEWMTSSLQETYAQFGADAEMKATPQNFIEKIFQIPFNLKPMSIGSFSKLIDGLFVTNRETKLLLHEQAIDRIHTVDAAPGESQDVVVETPKEKKRQFVLSDEQGRILVNEDGDFLGGEMGDSEINFEEIGRALEVREWESAFAAKLFAFIKTPRSAKRFVNIYRLLKVSVPFSEIEAFEGLAYRPGEFQLPMLLLALVVGCNESAPEILAYFYQSAKSGKRLSETLDDAIIDAQKIKGFSVLIKSLQSIVDSQWFQDRPELVIKWIPEVSRFSFQSIRLEN